MLITREASLVRETLITREAPFARRRIFFTPTYGSFSRGSTSHPGRVATIGADSDADDSGDAGAPIAGAGDGGGLVLIGTVVAMGAGALAIAARRIRNDERGEIS